MKKIILLTSIVAMTTLFSCQKEKVLAPITHEPVVAALTTDTLNVKVYFSDNVNFSTSDYTLTVVDVETNTVVDSTVVSGIVFGNPYSGNVIRLPRVLTTDGTIKEKVYNVFLGGRSGTKLFNGIPVVSGNVKDTTSTYNTTPNYAGRTYKYGFANVIVNDSIISPMGILRNQPHPESGFSETDSFGQYVVF